MNRKAIIGLVLALALIGGLIFVSAQLGNTAEAKPVEKTTTYTCSNNPQGCNKETCGTCGGQCGNPNCSCR